MVGGDGLEIGVAVGAQVGGEAGESLGVLGDGGCAELAATGEPEAVYGVVEAHGGLRAVWSLLTVWSALAMGTGVASGGPVRRGAIRMLVALDGGTPTGWAGVPLRCVASRGERI